jgi:Putative beta-lactamase-inhibitor-like, PepSY-like
MRKRIGMVAVSMFALSTLAVVARADDEKVSVKSLPAAVKKAIEKKFHKAEIEKATKEVEDGETTYEVMLEVDDHPVDVALKADGTILEIERTIPFNKLPAGVKKALEAKYPGAQIEKVEAVTKGEDGPEVYEIAIKTEVVFDAKGKVVKADDEDDEKPSAKAKKPKKHNDKDDDDDHEKGEKGHKD